MPLQFSRYYTLPEARELLPAVRGWFAQMDTVRPRVHKAEEVFGPRLAAGEDLGGPATIAFVRDLGQLHDLLREFHSRDIQLKDPERGLVISLRSWMGARCFSAGKNPRPISPTGTPLTKGFPDASHFGTVAGVDRHGEYCINTGP